MKGNSEVQITPTPLKLQPGLLSSPLLERSRRSPSLVEGYGHDTVRVEGLGLRVQGLRVLHDLNIQSNLE